MISGGQFGKLREWPWRFVRALPAGDGQIPIRIGSAGVDHGGKGTGLAPGEASVRRGCRGREAGWNCHRGPDAGGHGQRRRHRVARGYRRPDLLPRASFHDRSEGEGHRDPVPNPASGVRLSRLERPGRAGRRRLPPPQPPDRLADTCPALRLRAQSRQLHLHGQARQGSSGVLRFPRGRSPSPAAPTPATPRSPASRTRM